MNRYEPKDHAHHFRPALVKAYLGAILEVNYEGTSLRKVDCIALGEIPSLYTTLARNYHPSGSDGTSAGCALSGTTAHPHLATYWCWRPHSVIQDTRLVQTMP